MVNNLYEIDTEPRKPKTFNHIPKGLTVIDIHGSMVGSVKHFQRPSKSGLPALSEFPPHLRNTSMPHELIFRILDAGFVCVDTGFLAKNRFVLLYQIDQIKGDSVYLFASTNDLIKA